MTPSENSPQNPAVQAIPDELPPVKPPSAAFILQLFFVPGLIVLVIVGLWVLFQKLVTSEQDWRSLVTELRHPNELRRWRAAHGLATVLDADQHLGKEGQHLASNAEIAQSLADTFTAELNKQGRTDPELKFQAYLARTLGLFDLPDVVLPPLLQASQLEHERETDPLRTQVLEVRKNALASIGLMADRLAQEHKPLHSDQAVETLLGVSTSEDPLVRQLSAYVLGLIDDSQAVNRLKVMLSDADGSTRANAAIGLVRHDSTEGFDVIKDILKWGNQPLAPGADEDFAQLLALKNVLTAVERIAKKLSPEQKSEAITLVEPIADHFRNPSLRVLAIKSLHALQGKT